MDAADFSGQTALHWTAVRGSLQVAELLLEHGARLEIYDSHGYRVLASSCSTSINICNYICSVGIGIYDVQYTTHQRALEAFDTASNEPTHV